MARHHLARHVFVAGALVGALVVGPWSPPSLAATATQDEIASVEAQLAAQVAEEQSAAIRVQESAQAALDAEGQLVATADATAAADTHLSSALSRTGRLAAAAYRRGGFDPALLDLQVALSDGPGDRMGGTSIAAGLAAQDAVLRRSQRLGAALHSDRQALVRRAEELRSQRDTRAADHGLKQAAAAQTTQHLAALRESQRQQVEAERTAASAAAARGSGRAPVSASGSASAPAPAAVGGSCPSTGSRGAESSLTPATLSVMRCGLAAFPQIEHAGGWGSRGNATDHDDGRAVDFMIPSYSGSSGNALGWAVAEWARSQPGVDYVMFDSKMWGSWAAGAGWKSVSDRGSDTANHRDHVHVSVKP